MGTALRNAHWKPGYRYCNGARSDVHMGVTPNYLNGKQDTTLEETA